MFYKLHPLILFRDYKDFGFLSDNRNFGYHYQSSKYVVGDRVISKTGSEILHIIENGPIKMESLIHKLSQRYSDVSIETLQNDTKLFIEGLVRDGFILVGDTESEINNMAKYEVFLTAKDDTSVKITSQQFLENYFGGNPYPVSVHIEIASTCNERCLHCFIPHELKNSQMDIEIFERIIKQCIDLNILHLTISGGEPLLHPNILYFLKLCRENHFSVNLLTNLTCLSCDVLEELKKNPLLGVQTSIYSMNKNIHDTITNRQGSLETTLSSVLQIVENKIPIQISCPIMQLNAKDYQDVQSWASQYGISVGVDYSIIAQYNNNTTNTNIRLAHNELKEFIKQRLDTDPNFVDDITKEVEKNKKEVADDYICSICNSSICIRPDGGIYPCAGWNSRILGNIKRDNLSEIWYHSKDINYLRNLKRSELKKCNDCSYKNYCTICLARNANESKSGDPLEVSSYFCEVAKIKKEVFEEKFYENLSRTS